MKSLLIAWKDFKIRITDRKGFLTMILMPLVLTAILGAALDSVMGGDDSFSETTVGFYQADDDQMAEMFRKEVLSQISFIKVKPAANEKELKELLRDEKIDAAIMFPIKWSSGMNNGELKNVTILSLPDRELKSSVIESLLQSFSERIQTMSITTSMVMEDLTQSAAVVSGQVKMQSAAAEITADLTESVKKEYKIAEESVGKKNVSSMQYYAAAMAAMFLLFNATVGAKSFIQERATETLGRLMVSPTSNTSILIGKFLGTLLFALIQLLIFYTATALFFDVKWGDNLFQLSVIGISYSIAVSGIAMIIAALISDEKTTDLISGIGIQVFAILGGSMLPIYLFPDLLQTFANITPNKWALTSFLKIMSGTTWNELAMPIAVLLLMGSVSLTIGTLRLKAR
ncbi:ABC transporter permease [Bacillus sp. M6-12]|uniref:ABC transporter permease n=1 Tax=Bacillus sp. M6-12 TaxID=2054166 RepID=UPI000C761118|nr:ABC transporter permease [Bacillus sp. M6-12]PLS16118.1 ABC transporter permease [Bacillus sp. M6-12]